MGLCARRVHGGLHRHLSDAHLTPIRRPPDTSRAWKAFGAMCFAFVCHHSSFLVYTSLKNPTPFRWNLVTHISIGTALTLCVILSSVGYSEFQVRVSCSRTLTPCGSQPDGVCLAHGRRAMSDHAHDTRMPRHIHMPCRWIRRPMSSITSPRCLVFTLHSPYIICHSSSAR